MRTDEEQGRKLSELHWNYVCKVLNKHKVKLEEINIAGHHYREAFKHGFKHGVVWQKTKVK